MHPTLNDHVYDMRPTCVVHVVWHHFILESSTPFFWVLWLVLWLRHQLVTDVTAWLITPNPSCSKNRKIKEMKMKIKVKSIVNNLDTTFHSSYLSCNMPCGGDATIWIFHLPWWRYFYLTWSSMTELLLLVSQHWNLHLG